MVQSSHHHDQVDAKPDVQNKFGMATFVWFFLCLLVFAILIIMLIMSIFGHWQTPFIDAPV